MTRKIVFIILVFLLFISIPVYGYSDTGYVNISNIALYQDMHYSSEIIDVLTINNKVSILSDTNDWYKIKSSEGKIGWIEKYFVNVTPEKYVLNTCGSKANLRSSPTTSSKIIGQIDCDQTLKYIDTFHSWYIVEYNGQEVYMANWLGEIISYGIDKIFLIDDKINIRNNPDTSGTVIYQGNKYDSFDYYGEVNGWIKIKLPSGEYGYVAGWLTSYNNNFYINGIKSYKKTTDNLRLREGSTLNDEIITVMKTGTKVRVIDTIGEWDKIITESGKIGYGYNEYLEQYNPLEGKTILLNPGHGGKDPGAIGYSNKYEKYVNLDVTLKLQESLRNLGAKVIMSRTYDTYVSRSYRANISNNLQPDIMFSIHHNSLDNQNYFGMSTYYDTKNNTNGYLGKKLANCIYDNMVQINGVYRDGVYDRNFEVLRKTNTPAALIEIGFMSNKWEEKNIHLESFQNESVKKLSSAIIDYFETR